MNIQIFLQTIWASILLLGWFKILLIVIAEAILWRLQPLLGLLGVVLLIAYLAHWI